VVVLIHRSKKHKSMLAELLQKAVHLQVKEAEEKEQLLSGYVYLAPPDYHLLVEKDGSLSFDLSEPVMVCRPSIDVLFASDGIAFLRSQCRWGRRNASDQGKRGFNSGSGDQLSRIFRYARSCIDQQCCFVGISTGKSGITFFSNIEEDFLNLDNY